MTTYYDKEDSSKLHQLIVDRTRAIMDENDCRYSQFTTQLRDIQWLLITLKNPDNTKEQNNAILDKFIDREQSSYEKRANQLGKLTARQTDGK